MKTTGNIPHFHHNLKPTWLASMKRTMKHLNMGLALFLVSLAGQSLAQSAPQQVKGSNWRALTATAPAVATDGTNRYIAWKGQSNHEIYFAMFNGTEWTDHQIVSGPGWTAETDAAPALAYDGINVWVAWKGASSTRIGFSKWKGGTSWEQQQVVSGSDPTWTAGTDAAPALGITNNKLTVAWRGASSKEVWYTAWQSGAWTNQVKVSDSKTSTTPTVFGTPYSNPPAFFWDGYSNNNIYLNGAIAVSGGETKAATADIFFSYGTGIWYNSLFWKNASDNSLMYSVWTYESMGFQKPNSVSGAATNQAPAAAGYLPTGGNTGSTILAWKNATDNTVWFLDPSTILN